MLNHYLLFNVACPKLSLILNDILRLLINVCIYSFNFFYIFIVLLVFDVI